MYHGVPSIARQKRLFVVLMHLRVFNLKILDTEMLRELLLNMSKFYQACFLLITPGMIIDIQCFLSKSRWKLPRNVILLIFLRVNKVEKFIIEKIK